MKWQCCWIWAPNREGKHLLCPLPFLPMVYRALLNVALRVKLIQKRPAKYIEVNIYNNCPLCESWQEEHCLKNGRRTTIDPVLTESILQIMFSDRLNRNANTISWYIGVFEYRLLGMAMILPEKSQAITWRKLNCIRRVPCSRSAEME